MNGLLYSAYPKVADYFGGVRGPEGVKLPALGAFTRVKPDENGMRLFEFQIVDRNTKTFAAAMFLVEHWGAYSDDQKKTISERYKVSQADVELAQKMLLGARGLDRPKNLFVLPGEVPL